MSQENIGQSGIIKWIKRYTSQLLVLVVIVVALTFLSPYFLTSSNIINVLRQISTNLYIACGLTMILITGGIDLSTASIMALAGLVSTYMSEAGCPFILSLLGGLLAGFCVGSVSGFIISRTTLPPFIVTYSMQSICRGLVYIISKAEVVRLHSKAYLNLANGFLWIIPNPVIYLIFTVAITAVILNKTKLGRNMYAVGGNIKCAQYAGINTVRTKMFIYIASGVLSAFAGIVMTSRNTSMQPTLGTGMEMDAIAAVVLGGTSMGAGIGAVGGTIIGALIIGFINNGLNLVGLDSFYQYVVKGIIILFAVYVDYIKSNRLMKS